VGYYEKFFERMESNLPVEVVTTASRLFARCYEYRAEIRDELESSLAYVADAGRWVVGMEDWNSKMDKRLAQISELVLLANTLLVEYAVTGAWGAQGSKDALDGYLRHIAATVVLQNINTAHTKVPSTKKHQTTNGDVAEASLAPLSANVSTDSTSTRPPSPETNYNPLFPAPATTSTDHLDSPLASDSEGGLVLAARSLENGVGGSDGVNKAIGVENDSAMPMPVPVAPPTAADDDDDDVLNPFARAYQPPVSMESSLASLRAESENGSVYFNAMDSQHVSSVASSGPGSRGDRDRDDELGGADEPDSPVSLGEYECLEMDSIPQYVAFKPTALSRKRRLKQQFFGGSAATATTSLSASIDSLASAQTSSSPLKGSPRAANGTKLVEDPIRDRQRLMDLTYSYDFQRELSFNPFASPAMASHSPTDVISSPSQLDISARQRAISTVQEEEAVIFETKEQSFGHDREIHDGLSEQPLVTEPADVDDTPPPVSVIQTPECLDLDALLASEVDQDASPALEMSYELHADQTGPTTPTLTGDFQVESPCPVPSDVRDNRDSSSSIGSDELAAMFYSAPEEFSRLLHDDDTSTHQQESGTQPSQTK
jgi:hypothetical protein